MDGILSCCTVGLSGHRFIRNDIYDNANQLTDGLEKGFHFLKKVHVPVHEIAMMMSIALRFIPILTEELDKIMKAQMSRGVDFESGNILERGKKVNSCFSSLIYCGNQESIRPCDGDGCKML